MDTDCEVSKRGDKSMLGRSGYDDYDGDCDQWANIRWRGAVSSAIRGKRGQAFLKEMLAALDVLPEKKLIAGELELDGQVCALGAVGKVRGIDMSDINPEDYAHVAKTFGIPRALACEIMYENDCNAYACSNENDNPECRYFRMRRIAESWIKKIPA
jgi:hypothetical protein